MNDKELEKELEDALKMSEEQPERLVAMLDLKIHSCNIADKVVEFEFVNKEWCLNPYDGIHGGIICSIFDTSMGIGAVALSQHFVSTTELAVSYLHPMNEKKYIIRVEYTHIGGRLIRCMARAIDAKDGTLCSTAMGCFVITESRPKGVRV